MKLILYAIWLVLALFVIDYIEPSILSSFVYVGSLMLAVMGLILKDKDK